MDLHEVYRNSGLGKWFHDESANKTPGWDRYNSEGEMVGECGDAKKGQSYSACLSKQKADRLGKKRIANFVRRKRAAQSEAGRGEKGAGGKGQKPINVDTGASKMEECYECEQDLILEGKNKPNDPEKWSACKSAAKKKFDVYPSAYANAWAAKCYKKKGGTWRSIKEEIEMNEIKQTIKENIILSFMENAKPEFAPRGAGRQRPKSWSKGTKSGSDKRKMREEGKRQAREMNESKTGQSGFKPEPGGIGSVMDNSLADAISTFSGMGVQLPKTITPRVAKILQNELQSYRNIESMANEIARKGVGTTAVGGMIGEPVNEGWVDDESGPQERLIRSGMVSPDTSYYRFNRQGKLSGTSYQGQDETRAAWSRVNVHPLLQKHGMEEFIDSTNISGLPVSQEARNHPAFSQFLTDFIRLHTTHNKQHWAQYNKASPFHWPAIRDARSILDSLNRSSPLKETAQSWGPEFEGSAQDDMTARAYEEQNREESLETKPSHADVIEMLNRAHETALSRIATSYSKGGKHQGKDPYYMVGHYTEHLEDLHRDITDRLL